MNKLLPVVACAAALVAFPSSADVVYCAKSQYSGGPNDAELWSDGQPASDQNDYVVDGARGFMLAMGSAGNNAITTFAGKSLTIGTNTSNAGVIFLGTGGTGTTYFPCGIDVKNARISTINISKGNHRIITGEIRLHDDILSSAPQLKAGFRSSDQILEFGGKIVGNANTGMDFFPNADAGQNENTNGIVRFTGDLSSFSGTIRLIGNSGKPLAQMTTLQLGDVTFPGTVNLEGGVQSVLRGYEPTTLATIANLTMSEGSTLWVDLDVANSAAGCIQVTSALTLGGPVWVTLNSLQNPLLLSIPKSEYPILVAPAGVTLDVSQFQLHGIGLAELGRDKFSLKVATNDEGLSTLYVVKEGMQVVTCVASRYEGSPNDAVNWSDGQPANGDTDYIVPAGYRLTMGNAGNGVTTTFAGKSLTVGTSASNAGVIFLGRDGTGTTAFPCGIDIFSARDATINITKGNRRIIDGEIRLHDDILSSAPQLKAGFRSSDQTLEFGGKIVGNANTGMDFFPNADGSSLNTNCIVCFTGDLSEFYGTLRLIHNRATETIVLRLGDVTFPGTVNLMAGSESALRTYEPTTLATVANLTMSEGSTLWVDLDITNNTAGCFQVTSALTLGGPVWVTLNSLQDPVVASCPQHTYPILVAPAGVTLDASQFQLNVIGLADASRGRYFSLRVAANDEGLSTLYVDKDDVYGPVRDIVNATWTGAGADTAIGTAENWKEGLPSFTSGETLATFAEGGAEAVIPGLAYFNGFRFTADGFTVRGAADGARARLHAQGLAVAEGLTATLAVATEVFGDQTWTLAPGSLLNLAAPLAATDDGSFNLTVEGGGALNVEADGSTHAADILVKGGDVTLAGDEPLGTRGKLTMKQVGDTMPGFTLGDLAISKDVTLDLSGDRAPVKWTHDGAVAEFKGAFTVIKGFSPSPAKNGRLIFSGGLTVGGSWTPGSVSGGEIVISNMPISVGGVWQQDSPILIAAQGCKISNDQGLQFLYSGSNLIRFGVDEAFSGNVNLTMRGQNNRMDLNGHSQTFGSLTQMVEPNTHPKGISNYGLITNSAPTAATLHIVQNKEVVRTGWPNAWIGGQIAGPIDFWKDGTARIVVTNKIAAVGKIKITKGRFEFQEQATWQNATNVAVSGFGDYAVSSNGCLAVAHARNLHRRVTLDVSDAGTFEIPSGVQLRALSVTVDGAPLGPGVWKHGSTYDADRRETPAIVGAGELLVGPQGILMIIR